MAVQTALSGTRKAAILVLALGEEASSEMFKHLHEDEIEKIAKEIAALGPVASETGERVLEEFHQLTAGGELRHARRRGLRAPPAAALVRQGGRVPDPRPRRAVVQDDRGLRDAGENRSAAAVEVHPGRAPADDRVDSRAPERRQCRPARLAAARRAPGGRPRADGQSGRDLAGSHHADFRGHRAAVEDGRRAQPRAAWRHPRRRRVVQPARSLGQPVGARRRSRADRRSWRSRSAI